MALIRLAAGSGADGDAQQRPAADALAGNVEETAIIGQEIVPVERVSEGKGNQGRQPQEKEAALERFQTSAWGPKTPDQLQLQNSPNLKTNEDSGKKGEFPRLPSFLHGLLPGYDQLQEARQRELEWRAHMEMMVEQLGLQSRASHSENVRLGQELHEAKKESSRYGTPEETRSSEKGEGQRVIHGVTVVNFGKEDGVVGGVVTQQDSGFVMGATSKEKTRRMGQSLEKISKRRKG